MEEEIQNMLVLCACGCGLVPNKKKKYVHGHNSRVNNVWCKKGRPPWNKELTKDNCPTLMQISIKNTGHHHSDETKEKIRLVTLGNTSALGHRLSDEVKKILSEKTKEQHRQGRCRKRDIGEKAGAAARHYRIRVKYGKANHCEICGKNSISFPNYRFHWANLNHQYDYNNIDDWVQLCNKCHHAYDGGKIPIRELTIIERTGSFIKMGRYANN